MNFTSQICTTKEQSERLLALGLKKETADMHYYHTVDFEGNEVWYSSIIPYENVVMASDFVGETEIRLENHTIPAWSLHRLMEMIPFNLKDKNGYTYDFIIEDDNTISYYYFSEQSWYCIKYWGKDNLYDNFIDCIEWLINQNYFTKEYLN